MQQGMRQGPRHWARHRVLHWAQQRARGKRLHNASLDEGLEPTCARSTRRPRFFNARRSRKTDPFVAATFVALDEATFGALVVAPHARPSATVKIIFLRELKSAPFVVHQNGTARGH
jgi:hypothetical protein